MAEYDQQPVKHETGTIADKGPSILTRSSDGDKADLVPICRFEPILSDSTLTRRIP